MVLETAGLWDRPGYANNAIQGVAVTVACCSGPLVH